MKLRIIIIKTLMYHFFLMYKDQTIIERRYPKLYIEDIRKKNKNFSEK